MKLSPHRFDQTARFYRDVLRLPLHAEEGLRVAFEFGGSRLWLDRSDHLSQTELWLELCTDDLARAADYLEEKKTIRRDGIERLPAGFEGFWICSPANVIHLVSKKRK